MPARSSSAAVFLAASLGSVPALAQQNMQPAPALAAPAASSSGRTPLTVYGIQLNVQADAGVMSNPAAPSNGINFGHLFTDRANQLVLNQLLLTAQKPIDSKAATINLGFDFQLLYGTDARYTHFLGELDEVSASRYQLDIINANVQAHLPYVFKGGVDLKIGQYPTLLGYETIDPSTNPFYSHSYIFNFGLPFKHTGGYAIAHVSDMLDVYAGGDSGVNTTLGGDDNNSAPSALGGVNLTLVGGNLTILALEHIGPENPISTVPAADGYMRAYSDVVITYKASSKMTYVAELDWVRDGYGVSGSPANSFGAAGYASYALTDRFTLNGRAEMFRDDSGFFVAGFTSPLASVDVLGGRPTAPGAVVGAGANTYAELTLGVTYKPAIPAPLANMMLRPEIRWDHSFQAPAFNDFRDRDAVTIGGDVVIGF